MLFNSANYEGSYNLDLICLRAVKVIDLGVFFFFFLLVILDVFAHAGAAEKDPQETQ